LWWGNKKHKATRTHGKCFWNFVKPTGIALEDDRELQRYYLCKNCVGFLKHQQEQVWENSWKFQQKQRLDSKLGSSEPLK
jgi:hypothetical protein